MGKTKNQPEQHSGVISLSKLRKMNKKQSQKIISVQRQEISADIGDSCRWIVVQSVANDRHSPRGELWADIYTLIFRPLNNAQSESEALRLVVNEQRLQEMIAIVQETLQQLEGQDAESYPLVAALKDDLLLLSSKLAE
jgi:hypothetical protein